MVSIQGYQYQHRPSLSIMNARIFATKRDPNYGTIFRQKSTVDQHDSPPVIEYGSMEGDIISRHESMAPAEGTNPFMRCLLKSKQCRHYHRVLMDTTAMHLYLTDYDEQLTDENREEHERRVRCSAAAIYLEQGQNNVKLYQHPRNSRALCAYLIYHNRYMYILSMFVSALVLLLAIIEEPSVFKYTKFDQWFGATIEIICLMVIAVELLIKWQWLGTPQFIHHKFSLLQIVSLTLLLIELFISFFFADTFPRYSRCLRPLFILNTHYLYNVRRFARHVANQISGALDVLLLLFAVLSVFSLVGYFLFNETDPINFPSPGISFTNLFILMTTVNNPDVMLPSYSKSRWASLFFMAFLSVQFYFLMNLFLAVVYEGFSHSEKTKFRKLLCHRRDACDEAFITLTTGLQKDDDSGNVSEPGNQQPEVIQPVDFMMMMKRYRPTIRDTYLTYLTLNHGGVGVSKEQFRNVYDVADLHWTLPIVEATRDDNKIYQFVSRLRKFGDTNIYWGISYSLSALCGLWYLGLAFLVQYFQDDININVFYGVGGTVFVVAFTIDIIIKLWTYKLVAFCRSPFNTLDMLLTALALFALTGWATQLVHPVLVNLIAFRSLDCVRLLAHNQRFKHIFYSMNLLLPRLFSAMVALMLICYSYAIIGMELFRGIDLKNCCQNRTIEVYYAYYDEEAPNNGNYYLNNFDNIVNSFVTLWVLMAVNNWHIIMNGYAYTMGDWVRVYFMTFYLLIMMVLTVVVAFILDSFLFRMMYARRKKDELEYSMHQSTTSEVDVTEEESECIRLSVTCPKMTVDFLCSRGNQITEQDMMVARDISEQTVSNEDKHLKPTVISKITEAHHLFVPLSTRIGRSYESLADAKVRSRRSSDVSRHPKTDGVLEFTGKRKKNRLDYAAEYYKDDVKKWLANTPKRQFKTSTSTMSTSDQHNAGS